MSANAHSIASRFSGAFTALVTPFNKNDRLAYGDLKRLVEFQIASGIKGLVAVGTTGESPTLSTTEHLNVIAKTVEFAAGRVPVLAGTGSNATQEAIDLTRQADKRGADGFLLVAPYYNKPTQEGIYEHFVRIAEVTAKPILLYSIKSRCGIEIEVETAARLCHDIPNIVGIKDADGKVEKTQELVNALGDAGIVLCGDDGLTLPFIKVGARGVISVASNWLPSAVVRLAELALAGNWDAAEVVNREYADVFAKIFIEPNPVPIKYLLAKAGLISTPNVRLPLWEPPLEKAAVLDALFEAARARGK
jgi:4-hydroxy-tetrahydrodipicolinate synthase